MKNVLVGFVVMVVASSAWAQGDSSDAERRTRWLKDQLGLNDEQVAKVTEIYKKNTESEKKLEAERRDKIKEVLTDDQKKKYDDMIKQQDGGGSGRQPGGAGGFGGRPPGGFSGGLTGWIDKFNELPETLRKELTLSDEQFDKVKTIVDELKKKVQDRMDEFRQNGFQGLNWQEEMKKFTDSMKEAGDKVKEHLTEEQKPKFDKLVEEFQKSGQFGGGTPGGTRTPGGGRSSVDEKVKRAMDSLKIEKVEDAAAVKDLVKKVVEAQHALEDFDRDTRTKMDAAAKEKDLTEEALATRLKDMRDARSAKNKDLGAARKELIEIISTLQEAKLIGQGILN